MTHRPPHRSSGRSLWHSVVFVVALALSAAAAAQDKVVFQVTDGDEARWNMVLNNVRNLQSAVGDQAEIEVVAYGPGITLLKSGSPIATRITEAVRANVRVVACENTMASMKLVHGDMLSDVGFVPSGVVEVMRKQQQGYIYVRP